MTIAISSKRSSIRFQWVGGAVVLILAACANHPPAPVTDRGASSVTPAPAVVAVENRPGYYTVKKGDTLYGIALDNGQSHRDIAAWNNLENPNLIKVGQQLRVMPEDGGAPVAVARPVKNTDVAEVKPVAAKPAETSSVKREPKGGKQAYSEQALAKAQGSSTDSGADKETKPEPVKSEQAKTETKSASTEKAPAEKVAEKPAAKPAEAVAANGDDPADWIWPTSGKVGTPFAEGSSKGIDIPAKAGQDVVAANAGTVTLVSNALRGYGNLVVIKHSPALLSVYAHNSKILVKENQTVSKGQKIAEVGASDSDIPKLHFEIRRQGKPIDPLKFLPSR